LHGGIKQPLLPFNFPEKTSVFPAQTKKKEKIGTIFCPFKFREALR
jgi:hypothetical protein